MCVKKDFHEKTNINDIRILFENLTKKNEHHVSWKSENWQHDLNPGEEDFYKDHPVDSSPPFISDRLVEIFTSQTGKYAGSNSTCENDPPDEDQVIGSATDSSACDDDHLVIGLNRMNFIDKERLDDEDHSDHSVDPVDSSFPFLPDGLVEVFTSLTGKYGRNNPTSENCHNVGGTSKTNHNVPSEGKPFKRVKTGKGGSWRRGNCDNSDDEEKVIMTTEKVT